MDKKLMVFICVIVIAVIWIVFRKIKKNNQIDLTNAQRPIYKMPLAAGSVEYSKRRHDPIDASALQQEEMAPTSFWEWAIALLVISAGLIIPVVIAVFFGFSHFW